MDALTLDAWVTSDQHWGHENIARLQPSRPRDHFALMRRLWVERVREDDVLLHLGDVVAFPERCAVPRESWVAGLPGRKYLLRGNHDKQPAAWYEEQGFEVLPGPFLWVAPDETVVYFSHEPDRPHEVHPMVGGWDVNVHGHIHANPYYPGTPDLDYRNVSVEVTGFAPVRLRDVLLCSTHGSCRDGTVGTN